jgi:hypothetical protein
VEDGVSWKMRLATWLIRGSDYELLSPVEYQALTDIIVAQADLILGRAPHVIAIADEPVKRGQWVAYAKPEKPETRH